jgi:NhaP-type Na+/H+ or K+/H+ antiporter
MTFRSAERTHDYHAAMHEVVERLERLFTLLVLLMLGIGLTRGLLSGLDWRGISIGLALILVIRPLAGYLSLAPWSRPDDLIGGLSRAEQGAAAFFGVRGVGSIFYLAFALGEAELADAAWLWSTVAFTVVASVLIHGVLSTPVMRRLDEREGQTQERPSP